MNEAYYDAIDSITTNNLIEIRNHFLEDLKRDMPMVFVTDAKEDKKLIRKKIKAFNEVIEYFGQ